MKAFVSQGKAGTAAMRFKIRGKGSTPSNQQSVFQLTFMTVYEYS